MGLETNYFINNIRKSRKDLTDPSKQIVHTGFIPAKSPALILYSENQIPLAVLQINYLNKNDDPNNYSCFFRNESDDSHQKFVGVVINDLQAIEIIISNLTSNYINFNLMLTDEKVTLVDPNGINVANELLPFQSYPIRFYQKELNRCLVISSNDTSINIDNEFNLFGKQVYLSVVPQLNDEYQNDLFKSTFWKISDSFLIRHSRDLIQDLPEGIDVFDMDAEPNPFDPFTDIDHKDFIKDDKNNSVIINDKQSGIIILETGMNYNFDNFCKPCILSFDVDPNHEKIPILVDDLKQKMLKESDSDYFNLYKHIISKLQVYTSDTCCICMIEKPEYTFFSCGHKCVDTACLEKEKLINCPICRKKIDLVIPDEK